MLNQGVMNVVACFFGGMPMCHGAQGLAGQYYFGARTGGASILEGLIEVGLGLFLSNSLLGLFRAFPEAILGGDDGAGGVAVDMASGAAARQ